MRRIARIDRELAWLTLLAVGMRVVGCLANPVPGRDGVSYLWMAQQAAHGHGEELFRQVFHPLYPALVGLVVWLWPGLDIVHAGQLVAAGCSALAVPLLLLAARPLVGERAAMWAALMMAIGAWFVRHSAECLSEGPFQLFVVGWAVTLTRPRPWLGLGGVLAGAAFLTRPEGAALGLASTLYYARRFGGAAALWHATAGALVGLLLPFGCWLAGQGFVLTPKAAFNWAVGAGGAHNGLWFYLREAAKLPGDAWEGLGYLVFPLLLFGLWRQRPRPGGLTFTIVLPFAVQWAVIPLLRSNLRFVSGLGVLLLPSAGLAFVALQDRWRRRWRWWPSCLVLLLVASEAKLWLGHPADRTIERDLGRWLAGQLQPGESVCSDMPRLWFFAGQKPPPPREIGAEELRAWATAAPCRYVVLRRGRSDAFVGELDDLAFVHAPLPAALRSSPGAVDVQLWSRPR